MKATVKTPRFFYKDVQASLREIQKMAQEKNDSRQAMTDFLSRYELPENVTADSIVEKLIATSYDFYKAEEEATEEGYRQKLAETIAWMEEKDAYVYLVTLVAILTSCHAVSLPEEGYRLPTAAELQEEIDRVLAGATDKPIAQRIDELATELTSSNKNAFVYGAGNQVLQEALKNNEFTAELVGSAVAPALEEAFEKADNYAMQACACYGQILAGKVEGVTAENATPEIIAAVAAAGASKGSILKRLVGREIDRELAMELLAKVEVAFKWVLTQLCAYVIAVNVILCFALIAEALQLTGAVLVLVMVVGTLIGFGVLTSTEVENDCRAFVDILSWLTKFAVTLPFKVGKKIATAVEKKRSTGRAVATEA